MWIRHGNALYNSTGIDKVYVCRSKLKAKFKDGTEEVIGNFNNEDEALGILRSVSQAFLFENADHPGVIIKDTKVSKADSSRKNPTVK